MPMRHFYVFGALVATAVAAMLGLKVTEARAHCPVEQCVGEEELHLFNCGSDICDNGSSLFQCGYCIPV